MEVSDGGFGHGKETPGWGENWREDEVREGFREKMMTCLSCVVKDAIKLVRWRRGLCPPNQGISYGSLREGPGGGWEALL